MIEQFDRIVSSGRNKVVIKLDRTYKELLHRHRTKQLEKSNVSLAIDTSFDVSFHAPRSGVVVAAPKSLYYNKEKPVGSMPWDTDVEVQPGDRVWFQYLTAMKALGNLYDVAETRRGNWLADKQGNVYITIPYDILILALRGKEYFCLNGNLILEPVKFKYTGKVIVKDYETMECTVRCIGKPVREYIDAFVDADDISIGDNVIIRKWKLKLVDQLGDRNAEEVGKALKANNAKNLIYLQRKMIYVKMI